MGFEFKCGYDLFFGSFNIRVQVLDLSTISLKELVEHFLLQGLVIGFCACILDFVFFDNCLVVGS